MATKPPAGQCCGTCSAAREDKVLYNEESGECGVFCCYFPPIVVAEMKEEEVKFADDGEPILGYKKGKSTVMFHSRFPAMNKKGWCKQWTPKTTLQ